MHPSSMLALQERTPTPTTAANAPLLRPLLLLDWGGA